MNESDRRLKARMVDGTPAVSDADTPPAPDSEAHGQPMRLDDPRAIQILATEHWSLIASRALSWNESFSRASMFLASLSASVVALALSAQATTFTTGFVVFALVVLPFVELIGLATFVRLGEANGEDILSMQGMNRIRHAYLEIAPHLEPYFVTSRHDDLAAVFSTYGTLPASHDSLGAGLHHAFVMTQGMVGIINAMVAAVFGALLAIQVGAPSEAVVGAGALFMTVALGTQLAYGRWTFQRLRERMTVRFPSRVDERTTRRPAGGGGAQDGPRSPDFLPVLRDYPSSPHRDRS